MLEKMVLCAVSGRISLMFKLCILIAPWKAYMDKRWGLIMSQHKHVPKYAKTFKKLLKSSISSSGASIVQLLRTDSTAKGWLSNSKGNISTTTCSITTTDTPLERSSHCASNRKKKPQCKRLLKLEIGIPDAWWGYCNDFRMVVSSYVFVYRMMNIVLLMTYFWQVSSWQKYSVHLFTMVRNVHRILFSWWFHRLNSKRRTHPPNVSEFLTFSRRWSPLRKLQSKSREEHLWEAQCDMCFRDNVVIIQCLLCVYRYLIQSMFREKSSLKSQINKMGRLAFFFSVSAKASLSSALSSFHSTFLSLRPHA